MAVTEETRHVAPSSGGDLGWCANPFVVWLLAEGWTCDSPLTLIEGLARKAVEAGLPLTRLTTTMRYLHPQVIGTTYTWTKELDQATEFSPPHGILQSATYLHSPFAAIMRGEVSGIRRRLDIPGTLIDFPILQELKVKGITDYVAMPLQFSDGSIHAVTFSVDRPGGFTTEELSQLYDMLPVLGRLMEIHATRHTARTLLNTYVGRHAGERVLKGLIKRGDGETIHAVIWFSDLRGSTRLADTLPREAFLLLLNDYFECMAGPVLAHGGTVLRYVGDAVLAIFPIDPTAESDLAFRDAATACSAAVNAARDAMARVAGHNVRDDGEQNTVSPDGGEPHAGEVQEIRFGLALHLGDVMYGNIGVPERLEFTVIGPAANEAARLENMCKTLDRPVLLSASVAEQLSCRLVSLGFQAFRGVHEPQEVFTFPECASAVSTGV